MTMPSVIEHRLVFTFDDPDRTIVRMGLDCDEAIAGPRRFRRTADGWSLALPRPPLARIEYRLVVTTRDGATNVICDPGNPERVRTAFGDRSVALMPGYERPAWLRRDAPAGEIEERTHEDRVLGTMPILLWTPPGVPADRPAPLLIVNDGPEYLDLADLGTYAAAMIDAGELRPFRMALLQPVDRDGWYAANPAYTRAVNGAVRALTRIYATDVNLVVMGASLGGSAPS